MAAPLTHCMPRAIRKQPTAWHRSASAEMAARDLSDGITKDSPSARAREPRSTPVITATHRRDDQGISPDLGQGVFQAEQVQGVEQGREQAEVHAEPEVGGKGIPLHADHEVQPAQGQGDGQGLDARHPLLEQEHGQQGQGE